MNYFSSPWTVDLPIGVDLERLGELLSTKPVRFLVGAERAEFHLHKGLVASLSAPLDALVNRGAANMQDTSVAVFALFTQFVYSGHYNPGESAGKYCREGNGHIQTKSNLLLQHAQLWDFAQTYQVEPLQHVVQMQLMNQLTLCRVSPVTFLAEFGELVRYVYGVSLSLDLRQIVGKFAATVTADLCHLEGWRKLLSGCPGFSWDVLNAALQLEGW
ncbi:hypothetical protein NLG97_g4329 [Lecanicillium saksenae]|uniref:Uncharacterized protein n=1 Tax=Lecanicillium saksenae TaxID=468837 RepID=A0ACC1QW69_9HYPO|nr:hypothetical protein NLG97_g4329 [Lecanicillium saksenae]